MIHHHLPEGDVFRIVPVGFPLQLCSHLLQIMEGEEDLLVIIGLYVPLPDEAILRKECNFIFHVVRSIGQCCHHAQESVLVHKVQHRSFNHGIRLFSENQHAHIHRVDHQFLFPGDRVNRPGVCIGGGSNVACAIRICHDFMDVR